MTSEENTQQRILQAAVEEFAASGYGGARMEAIARRAGVNKAMLFYYFQSKENLYRFILKQLMAELFIQFDNIITPEITAAGVLEAIPRLHVTYFARHPQHLKIIGSHLLQNPQEITTIIKEILEETPHSNLRLVLQQKLREWHSQGIVSEEDPRQVMLNVVSLSLFTFIGLPMVETFTGSRMEMNEEFLEKRINSIVNLLKRGMLR